MDIDTLASFATSPLFAGAPEALVKTMMSGCETRELKSGEQLLAVGGENDTLYLVIAGSLRVHVAGAPRMLVTVARGECVGELSLIDGFGVSADVYANDDSLLLAIDREHLWSLMEQAPIVARNLLRILAGRVRNDDRMLLDADRMQRWYENAATVDALTGLRNRRWLDEAFARQLQRTRRAGHPVSMLMVDVDDFKRVNDTYGHLIGDEVLVQIGRALAGGLRPQDLLARYGGEEFAVLLPDVTNADAAAAAERLRHAVEQTRPQTALGVVAVTVSVGVATAAGDATPDLQVLLDAADRRLAEAKRAGRNCVRD